MIISNCKVTPWGNIETGAKMFGVAVRDGRKWLNCIQDGKIVLYPTKEEAQRFADQMVISLKERGLWKGKTA